MARRPHEEYTTVWWLTTIAVQTAPTVAEIGAGTNITSYIPKAELKLNAANDKIDAGDLSTAAKLEGMGGYGYEPHLVCYRGDSSDDAAWTLFKAGFVSGFLVVRRMVPFTTSAANPQKCEVYPVVSGHVEPMDTAPNAYNTFGVSFGLSAKASVDATIT